MRIKDRVFHHQNSDDFNCYGDTQVERDSPSLLSIIKHLLHTRGLSPAFEELAKKHLLMVVNVPNTEDAIVSYQFVQKWRDSVGRPARAVAMNFRLRRESAYKLLDLVRREPDAAEMFLQTAAEGFEAKPDTLEKVGIPRVRSDEVVLLNLDKVNPDYFNFFINPDTNKPDPYGRITEGNFYIMVKGKLSQALVQNQNKEIERLKYRVPHGVVEPDLIPQP